MSAGIPLFQNDAWSERFVHAFTFFNDLFERFATQGNDKLSLRSQLAGNDIGELHINEGFKNGFEIGFRSLDVDEGQLIAKELSQADNAVGFLKTNANVEQFADLGIHITHRSIIPMNQFLLNRLCLRF